MPVMMLEFRQALPSEIKLVQVGAARAGGPQAPARPPCQTRRPPTRRPSRVTGPGPTIIFGRFKFAYLLAALRLRLAQ